MDLDKIILEETRSLLKKEGDRIILDELCRNAMKEAIRQALELAYKEIDKETDDTCDDFRDGYQYGIDYAKKEIMSIMDDL